MRTTRIVFSLTLALGVASPPTPAQEPRAEKKTAYMAIPLSDTLIVGRVLAKDGLTAVRDAEVSMARASDTEAKRALTDRRGRFRLRLPAGGYQLQISRRMQVFKAPAVYQVPAVGSVEIDFLLLPDFETEASADGVTAPRTAARGPDPRPEAPAVVGSVVDMIHPAESKGWPRWRSALGFFGAFFVVALAAD